MAKSEKNVIEFQPQRKPARPEPNPFDLAMGLEAWHRTTRTRILAESHSEMSATARSTESAWKPKKKAA